MYVSKIENRIAIFIVSQINKFQICLKILPPHKVIERTWYRTNRIKTCNEQNKLSDETYAKWTYFPDLDQTIYPYG